MSEKKDPAFLFYPGDASDDTQFMNRLERGCYFDILKAQKKFRRFSLPMLQKVLGADFNTCWPAIELVLQKEDDMYFIGWIDNALNDRAAHSAKQKKRIQDYWDRKKSEEQPKHNHGTTTEQLKHNDGYSLEDEDEIANEDEITKKKKSVISKLDLFEQMFTDELFISNLQSTHRGKDIKQSFEECYTHHSNAPNPPTEVWEWKQKLNTWLTIKKHDNGTGKKDATHARREGFARRHS